MRPTTTVLAVCVFVMGACRVRPPQRSSTPEPVTASAVRDEPARPPHADPASDPVPIEAPCADATACKRAGALRLREGGVDDAVAAYERACKFDDAACSRLGRLIFDLEPSAEDVSRAMSLLERACEADDAFACEYIALKLKDGDNDVVDDPERAKQLLERSCDELRSGTACHGLFFMALERKAPRQTLAKYLKKGCDLGDRRSCESLKQYEHAPLATVKGANFSLGEVTADGQRIAELQCTIDRPMLGGLAVVGELSQSKAAFDRCAPKGDAAIVEWTAKSGRITSASARGANTDAVDRCIAAALRKTQMVVESRCAGVLLFGRASGAQQGLERLRANNP